MNLKSKINKVIKSAETMVLATASKKGIPHGAVVLCAGDINRIYFYTLPVGQKFNNLMKNKNVSLSIHNKEGYVQINGIAKRLNGDEKNLAKKAIIKRTGKGTGYHEDKNTAYFGISPKNIKLRITGKYPPKYKFLTL